MEKELLLSCLQTAKEAGCPSEQADNFVPTGYVPSPRQWLFHAACREADLPNGPVEIGMGGARGGGKSHSIFAQAALDDCQRVPKLKAIFIRKTAISAKESFGDLIERILQGKVAYNISNNVIDFANGSRIILGGFHSEDDLDKYVGIEYDLIVIEELNQLTEDKLEKLKGSLRTSKQNWRPRLYASFNPGGIGHNLVKERFVTPQKLRSEGRTRFISATYLDNTHLNQEYVEYLEGLQGDLGRAWREGDFDLFAGQFFKEWSEKIHVCQPFMIPDEWNRFAAFDYGLNHPLSLGWYAVSPDSQVFKYRQLHGSGMTYTQAAEEYIAMTMPNEKIQYISCDPALWAKKGEREDMLSGAEIFARRVGELTGKQPRLIKAENARVTGWGVVREYLRPYLGSDNVLTAKLQVFSTCGDTIKSAPEQVHSETVPEDMAKQDGDDSWDEVRYALMSRPRPTHTPEEIAKRDFDQAMKRKKQRLSTSSALRFMKG
mgnify:CR=1 FL=1